MNQRVAAGSSVGSLNGIYSMVSPSTESLPLTVAIATALDVEKTRGQRAFVVGGVVRDLVMKRPVGDFDLDIVVEGDAIPFAQALAENLGASVREHQSFLTAKVHGPFASGCVGDTENVTLLTEIDVASSRTEVYPKPGALPVVSRASIEDDLWRRDFSINAMAISLSDYAHILRGDSISPANVLDPAEGQRDIRQATVRVLHKGSFIDDPTRLFRAVRYTERLAFHFDLQTVAAFVDAVKSGALATLSPRRMLNEVLVSFDEASPSRTIEEFYERGLFSHLPLISENNEALIIAALKRLEINRGVVSPVEFRDTGRLLILAGLLVDSREDLALATHEGGKVIARARRALLQQGRSEKKAISLTDALAEYCLHGTVEARVLLEELLQGGQS